VILFKQSSSFFHAAVAYLSEFLHEHSIITFYVSLRLRYDFLVLSVFDGAVCAEPAPLEPARLIDLNAFLCRPPEGVS